MKVQDLENLLTDMIKSKKQKAELRKIRGSSVMKDPKLLEMLQLWVTQEGTVAEYEKIFAASKDGWNASDFHKHCDNEGPSLTIIQSSAGNIFGGFTKLNWGDQSGTW
jgi:hypothetical protein